MRSAITRAPLTISDAVQWTGDNLGELQAFMLPHSPYFHGPITIAPDEKVFRGGESGPKLEVPTRDLGQERQYPSLGRQYKKEYLHVGDWLYRDEGQDFGIVREKEFAREWSIG